MQWSRIFLGAVNFFVHEAQSVALYSGSARREYAWHASVMPISPYTTIVEITNSIAFSRESYGSAPLPFYFAVLIDEMLLDMYLSYVNGSYVLKS